MDIALDCFLNGQVSAGFNHLHDWLVDTRRACSQDEWRRTIDEEIRPHRITAFVHAEPLTRRSFDKPRGYAGDAVMMDLIYGIGQDAIGEWSPTTRAMFHYVVSTAAPSAVRFRRGALAEAIDATAKRLSRQIDVVALAAGHLREVELSHAVQSGQARITALDQDRESLETVARDYAHLGVRVETTSVRKILTRHAWIPSCDLAYTAGLFDYLPTEAAAALTRKMFAALRPGGALLLANFLPDIKDVAYMECFMDWQLIYRSDAEMRRLLDGVPHEEMARVDQFHDPLDNITFLVVIKRGARTGAQE